MATPLRPQTRPLVDPIIGDTRAEDVGQAPDDQLLALIFRGLTKRTKHGSGGNLPSSGIFRRSIRRVTLPTAKGSPGGVATTTGNEPAPTQPSRPGGQGGPLDEARADAEAKGAFRRVRNILGQFGSAGFGFPRSESESAPGDIESEIKGKTEMAGPFAQLGANLLGGLINAKIQERQIKDARAAIQTAGSSQFIGPATQAIGRVVLPAIRSGLPAIKKSLPAIAGGAVAGQVLEAVVDEAGRMTTRRKRRRRMNPFNPKAARRAGRRLRALKREMAKIEKTLPTRTVRRRAPAGHRSRLTHS